MHVRRLIGPVLILAGLGGCGPGSDTANVSEVTSANHSWNGYHWARTANPFTLRLGDNLSSQWKSYLGVASSDWSRSTVLDTVVTAGRTRPKPCKATSGQVEVCNASYGYNGWLGVATIWLSDGVHIAQGTVKVNDSYFNSSTYNTPSWRQFVMCQEVGHTFGLDHQDENFDNANLGTCMDYTSNPDGPPSNLHPNQHDYDELVSIYTHTDSFTTLGQFLAAGLPAQANGVTGDAPAAWGQLVRQSRDGRLAVYELDLGNGARMLTFVIWA